MDQDGAVDRLADRIGASRTETVGLVALVLCGAMVVLVLWWWQRPESAVGPAGVDMPVALVGAQIVVHVTGEVATPGVVTTVDGARVIDVIQLAGGASARADLGALNLARLVVDGEQVVVPLQRPPGAEGVAATVAPASSFDADGRLDLNRATAEEFEQLPGVGPVLAGRIVQYRDANGPFRSTGDLRAVAGIGEKTFQSLAPLIFV